MTDQSKSRTPMPTVGDNPSNAERRYEVTAADLPLHCPMDGMSLWDSHPRVYLPIEDTGESICPYCGARFVLKR